MAVSGFTIFYFIIDGKSESDMGIISISMVPNKHGAEHHDIQVICAKILGIIISNVEMYVSLN